MQIVICPGIHPPELTQAFVAAIPELQSRNWIFPAATQPAYSGGHILAFVLRQLGAQLEGDSLQVALQTPLLFIGFSAGVVGAIAAAHLWQSLGGRTVALIAIDGWGVPLFGSFPIHRVSHDAFTHWSSALLGAGQNSFYADPAVGHLDLWQMPQTAVGWALQANEHRRTTAALFLNQLMQCYQG